MRKKILVTKKLNGVVLVSCLVFFLVSSGCTEKEPEKDTGDDFTFTDSNGITKNLGDYRGKVVILDMWATWCIPCLTQMIELQKIYENYSHDDLVIISINIDPQEDTALINNYRENVSMYYNLSLDWIFGNDDPAGTIWYKYQLEGGIPTLCIFDQRGKLWFSQEGVSMFSDIPPGYPQDMQRLKPLLDTLLDIEDVEGEDFGFRALNGSVIQLHDYRGKVVILDMWATWCQPCLFQLIELKKAYDYYSREELEIFSVNIDSRENNTVVNRFLADFTLYYQYDLDWIFGQDDSGGTIWSRYRIDGGIPTLCIFDRAGRLQYSHEGVVMFNEIPPGYPQDLTLLQPLIEEYLQ